MITMRQYITDNGYEMMLPDTDERVMTMDELAAKYEAKKPESKNPVCPKCHTYCYGDCAA
mgnify:CR=1 FL=1